MKKEEQTDNQTQPNGREKQRLALETPQRDPHEAELLEEFLRRQRAALGFS